MYTHTHTYLCNTFVCYGCFIFLMLMFSWALYFALNGPCKRIFFQAASEQTESDIKAVQAHGIASDASDASDGVLPQTKKSMAPRFRQELLDRQKSHGTDATQLNLRNFGTSILHNDTECVDSFRNEDGSNEGGAGDAMGSVGLMIRISKNCLTMSEFNPLSLVTSLTARMGLLLTAVAAQRTNTAIYCSFDSRGFKDLR